MAGGGHSPKVAVHDVAALVGAVLLIASISLFFIPFQKQTGEAGEDYIEDSLANAIQLDLISGDSVSININTPVDPIEGLIIYNIGPNQNVIDDYWPNSEPSFIDGAFDRTEYNFEANESGTYTIVIVAVDGPVEWDLEIQRRWMQPYLMPLLGAATLGWGIWQGQQIELEEESQED